MLAPVGDRLSILSTVVRLASVRHLLRTSFPTCAAHCEAPRAKSLAPFYVFPLHLLCTHFFQMGTRRS